MTHDHLNPGPDPRAGGLSSILRMPKRLVEPTASRVWLTWRGQPLASPPTLEDVRPGQALRIVRGWAEQHVPFLKLADPEVGAEVDCAVRQLVEDQGACFVVLELADGWPGTDAGHRTLVRIIDPATIRTLLPDEFTAVMGRWDPPLQVGQTCSVAVAEARFGALPDEFSPQFRARDLAARREQDPNREILCFQCTKPVSSAAASCAHCGASRLPPSCPRCGGLVSTELDKRVYYADENGYYPWHHAWDGRCASCGLEFVAQRGTAPSLRAQTTRRFSNHGSGKPC